MIRFSRFIPFRNIMITARGLLIIFIFLYLGDLAAGIPGFPLPGNVTGMILIFFALQTRIIRLDLVKKGSDLLLKYMALFFVPPGVGLILYFDLIGKYWPSIVVSAVVSTLLVMWVTGTLYQFLIRKRNG